ncbi:MAG: metal-sulfur cluster assembly factor [Hyphomicrobiales bacterium]|nr:metal-sulfur cluster assembly factor [Hyphomicrobiales bacterium]
MADALPTEETIREALRQVDDPEVHINIVDLGLVYAIAVDAGKVRVTMTMTTPACPVGPFLTEQVEQVVRALVPEDTQVAVDLVWDPPWTPDMMSEMAKIGLGWSV